MNITSSISPSFSSRIIVASSPPSRHTQHPYWKPCHTDDNPLSPSVESLSSSSYPYIKVRRQRWHLFSRYPSPPPHNLLPRLMCRAATLKTQYPDKAIKPTIIRTQVCSQGGFWDLQAMREAVFMKHLGQNGAGNRRFHSLRHSFFSFLLAHHHFCCNFANKQRQ